MKRLIMLGGVILVLFPAFAGAAPGHEPAPPSNAGAGTSLENSTTESMAAEPKSGDAHPHPDDGDSAQADRGDHPAELTHEHAETDRMADPDNGDHHDESVSEHAHAETQAGGGHEHDHATDHGQPTSTEGRAVAFLGKFHPVVIHFPIALILFALALELLGVIRERPVLQEAAYYCVLAGALSAIVAAGLGWAAGSGAQFPQEVGSVSVLWLHRWLGVSTAALSVLTAVAGWAARKKPGGSAVILYRLLLVVTTVFVGVTGHFGASLVFGLNHFTL